VSKRERESEREMVGGPVSEWEIIMSVFVWNNNSIWYIMLVMRVGE
jgi:hypothetical protein